MIILSLFLLIQISRHKHPRVAEPFRNNQYLSILGVSLCDHLDVSSVDMVWWQRVLAALVSRELCSCQLSTSNIHREGLLPGALLSQSAHSIQQQTQYQSCKQTFAMFKVCPYCWGLSWLKISHLLKVKTLVGEELSTKRRPYQGPCQ